ncbi:MULTISPECIES: hypothetical protein [Pontibacillus]|uniref:Uncharacterized protein n=1 Tax=Pontibacillus marinus BH030004 = DSM 16465 TaxID=1385511 RepID=A0A0A5FQR3_9BACI|nr:MULTISPECIES: hypothetical protein [Pontibacillus]KGX83106.1 hypothetical protein N783_06860 [Pontibacillus marinus BH030004 = DSM 16465]QHE52840.1 hypothetical protein GS400_12770 [Pontibacillus sp. HMF3514]
MIDHNKRMLKWERTRKVRKWKYVTFGTMASAVVCFITLLVLSFLFKDELRLTYYIFQSIIVGLSATITSWLVGERRYKRLMNSDRH